MYNKHRNLKAKYYAQIGKSDPLREAKRNAIEVAIGLEYPTETLDTILNAEKDTQITRALTNARKSA